MLETSLKSSFLQRLSEKDRVAPDRTIEKAKVKETIRQVKNQKFPGKAPKFCWHSCFFKKKFVLFPYPVDICKNNTSITHLQSMLETSATPTHITERKNPMNYISQRPTVLLQHKSTCFYWSAGGKSGNKDPQL